MKDGQYNPCLGARRRVVAFSLVELLVVVGMIAVLVALMLPPLHIARQQAQRTQCAAHLKSLGMALDTLKTRYGYYPFWDDGGAPTRYTWVDVVIEQRALGGSPMASALVDSNAGPRADQIRDETRIGYCPADRLPDHFNAARHPNLTHPRSGSHGIDYSYGIGAPLAAGNWTTRSDTEVVDGQYPRRFIDANRNTASRVLAGDAVDSMIYNLNGAGYASNTWNDPTRWDNTVAWNRHPGASNEGGANLLFQDGHVALKFYKFRAQLPINTSLTFVWEQGEPIDVNPNSIIDGNAYPNSPPLAVEDGGMFPNTLLPAWYTQHNRWTMIHHK